MSHLFKPGPMSIFAAALFAIAIAADAQAGTTPIHILALGTSLTQGFGLPPGTELTSLLETKLAGAHVHAKIVNAGVSGDTSADGLSRLDWSLADHPDAAIVELGGNDALRGLPPDETAKNLDTILARLKAQKIPVLLLGMRAPRNFGPEYAAAFDSVYPKLAHRYGVLFYPFVLDGVAMNPKLNQADGIHPNPAGEKIVADRIFPDVLALAREVHKNTP